MLSYLITLFLNINYYYDIYDKIFYKVNMMASKKQTQYPLVLTFTPRSDITEPFIICQISNITCKNIQFV